MSSQIDEAVPCRPSLSTSPFPLEFDDSKLSSTVLSAFNEEQDSKKDETPQRVALLKQLEALSGKAFRDHLTATLTDSATLEQAVRVVFDSNLSGVKEGSGQFFELIATKCKRMALCRSVVKLALQQGGGSGFDAFEQALIVGCADISQAFDLYYLHWIRSVQDPTLVEALDSKEASTLASRNACKHLLSPYTMIRVRRVLENEGPATKKARTDSGAKKKDEAFQFECESYAVFFKEVLGPVFVAFDETIKSLSKIKPDDPMVSFLAQYRAALAETDLDSLEHAWNLVDRKWMDCQHDLQVVHDIEEGYSDPLRVKQGPDFSLRFLDTTYAAQNNTIKDIQSLICDYYRGRNTRLSADGLKALANTKAGIYYIPFKTGCSLVFSYSGQSIPNRLDVKKDKGVKIYFDAVETAARVELVKQKVAKIFADAETQVLDKYKPNAVEQLVWHVAAHEVGHAIYGTRNMESLSAEVQTMLEEPRAELTAMFTLRRLYNEKVLSLTELSKHLVTFALDAVRYFEKFDSQPMQPYIIFQIHAYNTYHKHGFLRFAQQEANQEDSLLLEVDDTNTLKVLDDFSELFENFLGHLDEGGEKGKEGLESILENMRKPSDFVRKVVLLCN